MGRIQLPRQLQSIQQIQNDGGRCEEEDDGEDDQVDEDRFAPPISSRHGEISPGKHKFSVAK